MGVNPTFKLGDFSVTPVVYQHLIVKDKKSGKSPWLLGPILIHYKEFRNYNYFFQLIGLLKSLTRVEAIGTDDERNIIEAAQQQFQEALLLRCFRHLQTNIERHLHSKQISSATTRLFIQDIFGWTDIEGIHRECLVDCKDADEFYDLLSDLKDTWLQRESCSSSSETFYDWFMKYKAEVFYTSTLQQLREAAGLGKPPIGYFTNPNESINSALEKENKLQEAGITCFY